MSLTLKVSFPISQDSFTHSGATSLPRGSPLTEDYPRRADRAGTRVLAHFPLDPTTTTSTTALHSEESQLLARSSALLVLRGPWEPRMA